jgi:hypothetical protein
MMYCQGSFQRVIQGSVEYDSLCEKVQPWAAFGRVLRMIVRNSPGPEEDLENLSSFEGSFDVP